MANLKDGIGIFEATMNFNISHQGWDLKRSWQMLARFDRNLDENNPLPQEMVGNFQLSYEHELTNKEGELVGHYEEGPSERGSKLVYLYTISDVDPGNGNTFNRRHIYVSREPTQEERIQLDDLLIDEETYVEYMDNDD